MGKVKPLQRGDRVHVEAYVTHAYDVDATEFADIASLIEIRIPGAVDSIFMAPSPNILVPRDRVHRDVRALLEDE